MSSPPDRPAPSTVITVGGLPRLTRAAATQTSTRSVLSGTRRSQSSRPMATTALPAPGPSTRSATPSRSPGRPPRRTGAGPPGRPDIRRSWPSGISSISTASTEKIRAASAAATATSPSKVSAALMSRVVLASAASMAAVRSARVLAR